MTSTKLNFLLLPLLVSILLSTGSKLKIGKTIDSVAYAIFFPLHQPIGLVRQLADQQISLVKNLPNLQKENHRLRTQNSDLLFQNEQLKQLISANKTLSLPTDFSAVIPVHPVGSLGSNTVSSTLTLEGVRVGQPLISGKTLIGLVSAINGSVITISPLDSDRLPAISVHTASGQKGQYRYQENISQITDVTNLSPLILDDYVFTEPGESVPGNLVIGKIKKIVSAPQEPLQRAEVSLETHLNLAPPDLIIVLKP